ncbi:MAG: JAB domain-containing protein [Acidobacteria bacterium]|nr:JAB domain-containing protein [Acidobacteriota bacterium]
MKPRERLLELGPKALTDGELVAILLRTGVSGKGVVELSDELLSGGGGLSVLFDRTIDELLAVKGLGKAKVATLVAVMELARRYYDSLLINRENRFSSPEDVHSFLKSRVSHDGSERFYVLFLDSQGALIEFEQMFRGNHSAAPVFVSEILKKALKLEAAAIIVAHNHPSGNLAPSREDLQITKKLNQACRLIELNLQDHLIFSHVGFVSLAERGELGG